MSGMWDGKAPPGMGKARRHVRCVGRQGAMSGVGMRIAMSGVCVWGEAPCQACGGSEALCQVCGTTRCHVRHEEGEAPCQVCGRTRCHVRCVGRQGAMSGVWGRRGAMSRIWGRQDAMSGMRKARHHVAMSGRCLVEALCQTDACSPQPPHKPRLM